MKRPPPTTTLASASIARDRFSAWAAGNAGSGSGAGAPLVGTGARRVRRDRLCGLGDASTFRALEDRCAAPSRRGVLTPSELRVVELAVEGRSNKEIAQKLFVRVHTVEVHLSHAYAKLGVRSRARLAALLVTAGRGD